MMPRSAIAAVALAAGAILLTIAASGGPSDTLGLAPGHNLLHVGCPPGSHGKPLYAGAGQRLQQARDDARAARPLAERALTAR